MTTTGCEPTKGPLNGSTTEPEAGPWPVPQPDHSAPLPSPWNGPTDTPFTPRDGRPNASGSFEYVIVSDPPEAGGEISVTAYPWDPDDQVNYLWIARENQAIVS